MSGWIQLFAGISKYRYIYSGAAYLGFLRGRPLFSACFGSPLGCTSVAALLPCLVFTWVVAPLTSSSLSSVCWVFLTCLLTPRRGMTRSASFSSLLWTFVFCKQACLLTMHLLLPIEHQDKSFRVTDQRCGMQQTQVTAQCDLSPVLWVEVGKAAPTPTQHVTINVNPCDSKCTGWCRTAVHRCNQCLMRQCMPTAFGMLPNSALQRDTKQHRKRWLVSWYALFGHSPFQVGHQLVGPCVSCCPVVIQHIGIPRWPN